MVQGEQALEEFSIDRRHRQGVTVVGIFVRRISRLSWSVNPPARSSSSITLSADVKCSPSGAGKSSSPAPGTGIARHCGTGKTFIPSLNSRPLRISVSVKEISLVAFWALFLMVLVCQP